jgi:hypothetical protein
MTSTNLTFTQPLHGASSKTHGAAATSGSAKGPIPLNVAAWVDNFQPVFDGEVSDSGVSTMESDTSSVASSAFVDYPPSWSGPSLSKDRPEPSPNSKILHDFQDQEARRIAAERDAELERSGCF